MADETRDCPACGRAVDVGLANCPACGGRWHADGSFTAFELPRLDGTQSGADESQAAPISSQARAAARPAAEPSASAPRRPTDAQRRRRLFMIIGIAVVDLLIAVALIIVYLSGAFG
jgi:hypothetical protein